MVSNFKPQKSPVDFVDVAARVLKQTDSVHFVMAGDGELRPEVEERIREHGIGDNITLLGWQHDMPETYRNLDVVVLTSLWEGLPCVFSEAMASELPVVATNVDGAREAIIDGDNGYLHEPHDIDAMATSVLKLVSGCGTSSQPWAHAASSVSWNSTSAHQLLALDAAYREMLSRKQHV